MSALESPSDTKVRLMQTWPSKTKNWESLTISLQTFFYPQETPERMNLNSFKVVSFSQSTSGFKIRYCKIGLRQKWF